MSETAVIAIIKDTVYTALLLSAPILICTMVVGLLISLFQATTQIQEQTLTFVPKLIVVAVVGLIIAPWMIHTMDSYVNRIFQQMITLVK